MDSTSRWRRLAPYFIDFHGDMSTVRKQHGSGLTRLVVLGVLALATGSCGQLAQAAEPYAMRVVSEVDESFLKEARSARDSVPSSIWTMVQEAGWSVELAERVVDAAPFLRGRRPRGWPAGMTWEHTDAAHLPEQRRIIVAAKRRNQLGREIRSHRVSGVLRHELGHAIDRALGRGAMRLSDSAKFRECYERDVAALPKQHEHALRYYLQAPQAGRQEAFAELFAIRYGGGSDPPQRTVLVACFPQVAEFLSMRFPEAPKRVAPPSLVSSRPISRDTNARSADDSPAVD